MPISTDCWETTKVIQDSLDPGVGLLYAQFSNEEYIQLEAGSNQIGAQWSGRLTVGDCVRTARQTFDTSEDGEGYIHRIGDDDGIEASISEVQEIADSATKGIQLATLYYDQCAVSWLPSRLKLRSDTVPHIEVSYGSETIDLSRIVDFIGKTATPHVVRALRQSIQPIDQFFRA